MPTPLILWDSVFHAIGAVITSSGTDTGYSPYDVADHRSYKGWQGSVLTSPQWIEVDTGGGGLDADSLLIVNSNLVLTNGATVKVYAGAAPAPATVIQASYSPLSDYVDYKGFTAPGAKRYWRVEFTDPSPPFFAKPFVGELVLGLKMDIGQYVAPDVDPRFHDIEAISTRSEGGHYLGTIYRGISRRGTLRFGGDGGVPRWSVGSQLDLFLRTHYRKGLPFGLVFDTADSELAAARWMKKPDDAKTPTLPVGKTYANWKVDLAMEEALMEAVV